MLSATCSNLRRLVCLLAVVLAIAAQISATASSSKAVADSRSEELTRALADAIVMCEASRGHATPAPHRHTPDAGILGILACSSQAVALADNTLFVPSPGLAKTERIAFYVARAPPDLPLPASYPRGPPA